MYICCLNFIAKCLQVKTATYHNMLRDIHSKILPVVCAEEVPETFEVSVISVKCKEESDVTILEGQADLESAASEEEIKMAGESKTEETEHDCIVDEERQVEDLLSDVKDKIGVSDGDIVVDPANEPLTDTVGEDSRQLSEVEEVKVKAEPMDYE